MKYVTYINMNDEVLKQNNFGLQKNKPTKLTLRNVTVLLFHVGIVIQSKLRYLVSSDGSWSTTHNSDINRSSWN